MIQRSDTANWFAKYLQPHESSLRAYLRSSLPNNNDIDDIVQDSYAKILQVREKTDVRNEKALLFTIARNAVRDYYRHKSVIRHESLQPTWESTQFQSPSNVEENFNTQQELQFLSEAIRSLPPRCREVFLLKKIHGYSQKDIAERLRISENTVETLIAKGLRRCRDYMRNIHSNHSSI